MLINTKDGYIETRIYQSIYHGLLNFDITGLYCRCKKFLISAAENEIDIMKDVSFVQLPDQAGR